MKENEIKKLELNVSKLESFDNIMSNKLDEIEELKITGLDKGSRLLNIITLCPNVKTLILEGDQRINTDKVLSNIFKPQNLENLIFNNVKIPSIDKLKRFTNLKMISLNDIRSCNIKNFLNAVLHPENIEIVNITNTDMSNCSIEILKRFARMKYLKLEGLQKIKINDLCFLEKNKKLLKIELLDDEIAIKCVNYLMNFKCEKNISVYTNKEQNCKFKVDDKTSEITVLASDLENKTKEVNLYKIDRINVIINEKIVNSDFVQFLKSIKDSAHIILGNFSYLNTNQAQEIKKELQLNKIEFMSENGVSKINMDEYILILGEIESITQKISNHVTSSEKFLEIYQYLGKKFDIVEKSNIGERKVTSLQICQILKNCSNYMGINCNIIKGKNLENKKHYWNQVELDKKWYNVDLALDLKNIKKNYADYCLLGDEEFLETHKPEEGKNNYCVENFNPKLINVFFKTGLFKDKLIISYIELIIEKFKKLFQFNKKEEVLALPESKEKKKGE